MLQSVPMALKQAEQQHKNDEVGQNDLFGDMLSVEESGESQLLEVPELPEKQRLAGEKETLGLYMTGHPIDMYQEELKRLVPNRLSSLRPEKWKKVSAAGLVVELRSKVTRNGQRMGFISLDDKTARLEVVMRPTVFEAIRETIKPDMVVMVQGEVAEDTFNGGIKLDAEIVVSLAEARVEKARAIKLKVNASEKPIMIEKVSQLQTLLGAYQSEKGLPVVVDYTNDLATVQMKTHVSNQFFPDDDLIEALNAQGWFPEVVI